MNNLGYSHVTFEGKRREIPAVLFFKNGCINTLG